MKRTWRNYLSVCKKLLIGLLHVVILPAYFFWPKYGHYIFVLTTGRSGSGTLASGFKGALQVNSNHEPRPTMDNYLFLNGKLLKYWNWFLFYFVKLPTILLSCNKENKIYLETNHLFIKHFASYAVKVFGDKMNLIHLQRDPCMVAKSIYEIGIIPGKGEGVRWYLDPCRNDNELDYETIVKRLKGSYDPELDDFYRSLWYWFEIECRIKKFKSSHPNIKTLKLRTSELGNRQKLVDRINQSFDVNFPSANNFVEKNKINKNLKIGKKKNFIDMEKAKKITNIFYNIIKNLYEMK